ncbi:hypothetical protein [Collimonas sp.]|jgi:hypothetical protein|uniref:hypothetical protein n=1 Tax=Collimonas sp. TaxID=1963772 RepID=UPI002C100054|nr:hypothetical protein [Collimonas sp.]HWW05882.1 hypothetical protein [Collimonas sp.]
MFEKIEDYFYDEPGRIIQSGKWTIKTGVFLILAGAIGQVPVRATNALFLLAKQPAPTKTLADIYPTLPLWWVPESWLGIFFPVAIIAIGISVSAYGHKLNSMFRGV